MFPVNFARLKVSGSTVGDEGKIIHHREPEPGLTPPPFDESPHFHIPIAPTTALSQPQPQRPILQSPLALG
jgi:hypothetical protein